MKLRPLLSLGRLPGLAGLLFLLVVLSPGPAVAGDSAPEYVFFLSSNTTFLDRPVPVGAVIKALDPQGVKCGQWVVMTEGQYGAMSCQRDDPSTPEDEGPQQGERISFTINGLPATAAPRTLNGNDVPPSTPVVWSGFGDLWEVDLSVPGSDLSLTKSVGDDTARVGQEVAFNIKVRNHGSAPASGVEVTDLLPAGFAFVSAMVSQGSYDRETGVWTVGTVAEDSSIALEMVARVTNSGVLENCAEVTKSEGRDPDSTPGNGDPTEDDQDCATVEVPTPRAVGGYGEPLNALGLLGPWAMLFIALATAGSLATVALARGRGWLGGWVARWLDG